MAKYLVLFEVDVDKAPADMKERGAAWGVMAAMVKQDLEEGTDLDWGCSSER